MTEDPKAIKILIMNTLAFSLCFAVWMLNGVLVTFLTTNGVYKWSPLEIGVLMAIPVLTGSLIRLPVGIWTDKYGGRIVYFWVLIASAIGLVYLHVAHTYFDFVVASLIFGLSGTAFAVGIAYTSVWFSKKYQGFALGIFGAGNAGSAITLLGAPKLLNYFTANGTYLEGWRWLPIVYAIVIVLMAIAFWFLTEHKLTPHGAGKTFSERMAPLRHMRVWRFGAYYFLVFGGFVGLSQWLVPYYVKGYGASLVFAGALAAIFSFPSGVIRALGGWLSDHFGARRVMYWVLSTIGIFCFLLFFPQMTILSPGNGITASEPGKIISLSGKEMIVENPKSGNKITYKISGQAPAATNMELDTQNGDSHIWPTSTTWQYWTERTVNSNGENAAFKVGDEVKKGELLARGMTQIYFQANIYIFTFFVFVIGIAMGIGKAAVYKYIPDYFPEDVGVVGGMVGVLGGLGGFFTPIIFGWLLQTTGIWTTSWMFFAIFTVICLVWLHLVVQKMMRSEAPFLSRRIENENLTINN
ncbi:MAG: NarK/NasA family nitrate transporter [Bacteroidetes bacterium]|nr:NarK/NasA family nitrate transporter [Bacteroidota bacterium]